MRYKTLWLQSRMIPRAKAPTGHLRSPAQTAHPLAAHFPPRSALLVCPFNTLAPSSVPANPSVTLTATSVTDAARSAPANITVTVNPGNAAVTVSPKRAAITKWQTQTFTATVTGSNNVAVIWQVDTIPNGNATVGTIDSNGKYTPPASAGAHMITVVSNADVSKSAAASIGVTDFKGVFTYHNDASRAGVNAQEHALTNANFSTATFR